MRLVDTIEVQSGSAVHRIELLVGDLAAIPDEHRVDVLVVSAFPRDYSPTPTSLIGALHTKGLDVGQLARQPEADLRANFSCWISRQITPSVPGLAFQRILCFEPAVRGRPPDLVGDIFRALAPFVFAQPALRSMAMPVVAAGDQGFSISTMLPPLLDAAKNWLAIGFPMDTIKLVVRSEEALLEALPIFKKYQEPVGPRPGIAKPGVQAKAAEKSTRYDVFVSYSRQDEDAARHLSENLTQRGVRVFVDRSAINTGASWQQKIYDALETCSVVAALYSPGYVKSKMCKEELNISLARRREMDEDFIFPLLIRDAELPVYMRMLNYIDCRISDKAKIASAAGELASRLPQRPAAERPRGSDIRS
jgi:hypothetical protein